MPDDPHCSKCCPVKPPEPPDPVVWPWGVFLWLAVAAVVMVGGWGLIMWAFGAWS
ncbi:hypothetical protein ABZ370_41100 [Streptomyces sp. NPDC005962]|uniref:hypothetical protein n=1 Tax=Streptomyces sp. NPDC005962 TaxID=3154466 RepID=UPI0033F23341